MKSANIFLILVSFLVFAGAAAWGAAVFASGHFMATDGSSKPVICHAPSENHVVIMEHDQVVPWHTYALRCDTLTIKNTDNVIRLIAFGPHEHHVAYDGVKEQVVGHNDSLTITLNAAGTYHFHDHIHDALTGEFTVTP